MLTILLNLLRSAGIAFSLLISILSTSDFKLAKSDMKMKDMKKKSKMEEETKNPKNALVHII